MMLSVRNFSVLQRFLKHLCLFLTFTWLIVNLQVVLFFLEILAIFYIVRVTAAL